ncbi:MAG: hypothetical protein FJ109_16700, partial [Deltaproteobacteria bacterium]|nr:hypothetical protein [Deltaproteobacteria bacterium]
MKGRGPFLFLGLLIGFFSLAAQSLLFREHLLAYAGNEAGIAVFLSAWMVWVAVGGVLGRGFRKAEAAGENLPWLLLLYPAAFLVQLLLFWSLRPLSGVGPTEQLPMAALVGWTLTLAAPVSLVTGFLFTRVARVREAQVREGASATAARLYGAEALGGPPGGASYTAAVLAGAPVLPTALGLLLFWLLASAWFSYRSEAAAAARVHLLVAVAASAAWLAGGQAALERRRLEALPVPAGLEVLETADTPYQHVLVAAWGRTRSVFANGELSATLPGDADVTAEAALLLAEKPDAREILVLGAGAEPLVCELLRVPAVRVTHVSDDGRMAELTARHLPRELSRCLASPALRQVTSDSRRFLSQATPRFDVVVARFGEPRTAQAARFYTAEFFGLAQSALAPGGLFSVSISAPPNVLAAASLAYAAGVHKTLTGVFGQVVFTSGSRMTFLAAAEAGAVTDRPDELERRFERLRSHLPEVEPGVLATRFESARIAALEQGFSLAGSELTATDESPSVFLLNLMVEYRATRLYELFRSVRSRLLPGFLLGLACLAVALLVGRGFGLRRGEPAPGGEGRLEGTGLLALTGFSGMLGQVVLLLGYQVRFGSLLAEFGLLNALYMLGLFAGTVVAGLPRVSRVGRRCLAATSLAALALSIALVFGLVGGGLSAASEVVQRGAFFAVCLVTGCAAAGVIVAGTRLLEEGGMTVAGVAATVQAADNAGAVAGALGGGLVLLPAAGLSGCALAASALPAVPFLAMLVGSRASGPGKRPAPVPGLLLGRVLFFAWLLLGAFGWLLPALAPAPVSAPSSVAASVDLPGTGAAGASRTSEEGVVSLSSAQVAPGMAGYGGPMDVVVDLERNERIG